MTTSNIIEAVARRWALSDEEVETLCSYLLGKQRCMDYDVLSITLQAAVNDVTRRQELLDRESRIRDRCRPSDFMAAKEFTVPAHVQEALKELREFILETTVAGSSAGHLSDYALSYIHGMDAAVMMYGERGMKSQLLYLLGNLKGLRGSTPRRLKAVLKEAAK